MRVRIAAADAVLRVSGALWLEGERALVVADVHFEKGSAYAARGQLLPPYDTRDNLRRLAAEAQALRPRMIVMLGDAFHDEAAEQRLDPDDFAALCVLASGRTMVWVTGNHDPAPPARPARRRGGTELDLGGLVLRHEPSAGAAAGEAAGHLHPCARIKAGGRSVRRRCFVTDGERLVLPAFGAYAGGLNIRDAAFAGLFARPPPLAVALGPPPAHPIGWRSVAGD
ncbi:MAG: ligase-associated DNA damage response endonuclease PdeM [Caulobacteraceae bacterium]